MRALQSAIHRRWPHGLVTAYFSLSLRRRIVARRLVTINPNTGVATSIGVLTNQISSLAFRSTGTLWAVSGDGGSPAETLYTVNTSNAALTLQFALGNGADGETIAFHGNGLMYHSSGNASAMFESVNVDTQVVTPIGTASARCSRWAITRRTASYTAPTSAAICSRSI